MGNCNLDCFTPNSPQIQFEKGGKVIKFDLSQDGAESTETNFRRKTVHHNTVGQSQIRLSEENRQKLMKSFEGSGLGTISENPQKAKSKFQRKDKRTISLVEKSKMGSQIHKEELRLSVTNSLFVNEVKGLPNKKYKIISKIGTGAYGTVFLAENLLTKANVAMKKIDKSAEDLLEDNEIKDEIEILKKLDHPNIVKILEFYNTPDSYYIINDYCPNGELYYQINKQFSETQMAVIFRQIFSGLSYLHENNIIHRDLKLENILITDIEKSITTKEKLFNIKIIDFGTAKIFDRKHSQYQIVGSSYYLAPEVINHSYNEKCDMWSAGVILYMLLCGVAPFDGKDDTEIIERIKKGNFNKTNPKYQNASDEIKNLIENLLEFNANKRLSALDALHHPWFTAANSSLLFSNIPHEKIIDFIHNLLSYKITSKLQEMVMAYIIHNMPKPKDSKDAIKLFQYFNEKGDGKLTKEELRKALLNFVDESIMKDFDDVFIMLDGGNNGFIQYEEFLRACLDKKEVLTEEILVYAFNFFDNDNSGFLSVDKIKPYFIEGNKVSEEVFKNIFAEIDQDNDGLIDFKEFKDMMTDSI